MIYKESDPLPSWNDGAAKTAIENYVNRITRVGSRDYVPPEARTAVFDNDGTLWCEKPLPIELVFVLKRLFDMASHDAVLRCRQPWKSAYERDYAWLGGAITKHYLGDDSDVKVLVNGILRAFEGMEVEAYETAASAFLHNTNHPTLGRRLYECGYQPMVELLRYLEAHGFTNYIASGGDRDFMRSITREIYGIPPQRVIGSSNALRFQEDHRGGEIFYLEEPDVFDDGAAKPVRIWSRVGRRPIFAVGNSNGDIPMLRFCSDAAHPSLRLLVNHDDEKREFAYQTGAEALLECAKKSEWTVVSVKDDWKTVFAGMSDAAEVAKAG
jgi:phosphoglycolate phosphatase-like HAD superfamily hydrolase